MGEGHTIDDHGSVITTTQAPAGWYPDPGDASGPMRYWDGAHWTTWQARGGVANEVPLSLEGAAAAWEALRDRRAPWPGVVALVALVAGGASAGLAFAAVGLGDAIGFDTLAGELVFSSLGLYSGLLLACWGIQRRWGTPAGFRVDFGIEHREGDWWRGLLASLAARGMAGVLAVILVLLINGLNDSSYELSGTDDGIGWATVGVFAVIALVFAPLVEELFFRGVILRSLETVLPGWLAIGVQGAVFGLAHGTVDRGVANLFVIIPIGVTGMVLGWLARRYQRLGPGIAAHAWFNLLPVLLMVLFQSVQ
jgi:membrane protease YdiL (CAAX protease family)